MPYIPPEVVEKAREMDWLTYMKSYEPQELVHFGGNTYCTREHDSLNSQTVSGVGFPVGSAANPHWTI